MNVAKILYINLWEDSSGTVSHQILRECRSLALERDWEKEANEETWFSFS